MHRDSIIHRRDFLRTFAVATAYSSFMGKAWTNVLAAEVQPLSTSTVGLLKLKVSDFPALQAESGSVRLTINPLRGGPPTGPTPNGQFYPVIINRGANNAFYALNSRCTHQNCVVDPMDASTNQMFCPCHGSVFAMDGRRVSGLASGALGRYTVSFDGANMLQVQIPGLGYAVTASNLQDASGVAGKLRLTFRALRNVTYEVLMRESIDQAPVPVKFSVTADGALDQTEFTAAATADMNLFVERNARTGFYSVAVRVAEG